MSGSVDAQALLRSLVDAPVENQRVALEKLAAGFASLAGKPVQNTPGTPPDLWDRIADSVSALASLGSGGGSSTTLPSYVKTANSTPALAEAGGVIDQDMTVANTVTIPPHSSVAFPKDTVLYVRQRGTGPTTVVAGAGVTVHPPPNATLALRGRRSMVMLQQAEIDEWVAAGDVI